MSTPPSSAQSPPHNKPRKKRSADVVSFEDLLAAHKTERGPGQLPAEGVVLIGVDLELQRRMAERIRLPAPGEIARAEPLAPNIGAPSIAAPPTINTNIGAPKIDAAAGPAPDNTLPAPDFASEYRYEGSCRTTGTATQSDMGAPISSAPNFDAPNFTEPAFDLRDLLIRRTATKSYAVHSVSRIEDVFTSAERDLLRWLWERGRPVPMTPRLRLVTGPNGEGARRLAVQAGLIYNTFKNLTHALSTKFALDIVKPERNLPTIYAVYHYSAILERQRQAGFTGAVHKNGGGRELVNAQAQPALRRPDLTVEELERIIGAPKSGALKSGAGAPNFGAVLANFGAPKIAALIRKKEYTSEKENTSSTTAAPNSGAPTIIVAALFERTGRTDVDAARLITKGCIEANATVQPEEIARLIRTAQIPPKITNPVGLLIRALPSRCAPESIGNYREQWRKEEEQEKRRQEQARAQILETAGSILESVSRGEQWDNDTIEWAKAILAENGGSEAATG
jgi:hypothetical protein